MNGEGLLRPPHRLVRASAGSGKTHRLALRFLEVLFAGGRPESIAAATFTRAAAGEILGRALVRLARGVLEPAETAALREELSLPSLSSRTCGRALDLVCDSLDRLSISTLDSLYYRMTSALRFELGLATDLTLTALDDAFAASLREEALEAALETLAGEDWEELVDLYARLHGTEARRSIARGLDEVLRGLYEVYREAPAEKLWGRLALPEDPEPELLEESLATLVGLARDSPPGPLSRGLEANLAAARQGDWRRLLATGPASKVLQQGRSAVYSRNPLPAAWLDALEPLVAHARARVLTAACDRTRASWRFLDRFDSCFREVCRRRGVLLFGDLSRGLVAWLGRGGAAVEELYYRMDGRIAHLLLDEFQDTSLEQWRVLLPIALEIRAHGDGSRSFFCVGDPKQAIYGWRGGCADLFEQIEVDLALAPEDTEHLDVSFRSAQTVLDVVNRVFGNLGSCPSLAEHAEAVALWSGPFAPHRAAVERAGYVELREGGADDETHAAWVASRLAGLGEHLGDLSLGVLVQTNRRAAELLDALRGAGVAASGLGGSRIDDDIAVAIVVAALRFVDHPSDTAAAFRVLHSPLAGRIGLRSLSPRDRLRASREVRRRWWEAGGESVVADWVGTLDLHGGPRSRRRLAQLLELTGGFLAVRRCRPAALARYLGEATVASAGAAGVRVMTIHRAKGLEFDAVVLPHLDGRLLSQASPVYLVRRSPLAPVEAVHRGVGRLVRSLSPSLVAAHAAEEGRRLRDDLSALYVAMTRARRALFLWPKGARGGVTELSFATILRESLGAGRADEQGRIESSGNLEEAVEEVTRERVQAEEPRQAELPLGGGRGQRSGEGGEALRPRRVVSLAALAAPSGATGLELLRGGPPEPAAIEDEAKSLEAALQNAGAAEGVAGDAAESLLRARAWLDAARGRRSRLASRFAVALDGRVVTGQLRGVSAGEGPERRLVVVDAGEAAAGRGQPGAGTGGQAMRTRALREGGARVLGLDPARVAVLARQAGGWRLDVAEG